MLYYCCEAEFNIYSLVCHLIFNRKGDILNRPLFYCYLMWRDVDQRFSSNSLPPGIGVSVGFGSDNEEEDGDNMDSEEDDVVDNKDAQQSSPDHREYHGHDRHSNRDISGHPSSSSSSVAATHHRHEGHSSGGGGGGAAAATSSSGTQKNTKNTTTRKREREVNNNDDEQSKKQVGKKGNRVINTAFQRLETVLQKVMLWWILLLLHRF